MERDSFIFYIEYKEALNLLKSEKQKLQFYELLTEYVFYNNIPQNIDEEIKAMFILIKKRLVIGIMQKEEAINIKNGKSRF